MLAALIHDTELRILILQVNGMTLSYRLSECLTEIKATTDCDEGFMIIETNYGEKYADFTELLETTSFDKKFIKKCSSAVKV